MPKQSHALADAQRFIQRARLPYRTAHFGKSRDRSLRFEPLEGRYLLSATPNDGALQVFSASTALFVANQGQWQNDAVRYSFDGPGVDIAFTDEGLDFVLTQREARPNGEATGDGSLTATADQLHDLHPEDQNLITHANQFSVSFDGANTVTPVGLNEAVTRFNYLIGDQANWREGVAGFATVAYEGLYDGIDLHTFGRRDSLKYEFYVAPASDWRQIQISYDGIEGLSIDDAGALHIQTELGTLVDTAPYIYQWIGGQQVEVAGSFVLVDGDTYAFEIQGVYDPNVELVIDPYVQWSTYFGGTGSDYANDVAVDAAGEILVIGDTNTANLVSGGYDLIHGGGSDAYVVKISATGQHLWSTYLGGTGTDHGEAITVNTSGEVLAAGQSRIESGNWVANGYDVTAAGEDDAFVVKLSTSGTHIWSTFIGGSFAEIGSDIGVDSAGNILVVGQTSSTTAWWPAVDGSIPPLDQSFNGGTFDAFAAKLDTSGNRLWTTYLGGTDNDHGQNVAVQSTGTIYISGYTKSAGWVTGGFDTILDGGQDAFVIKIASSSGNISWSTYLGGNENSDNAYGIVADASGDVYVTGYTESTDWVSGGFDTTYNGDPFDGFVAKLSSAGSHLWSTYLGGTGYDYGEGIAINSNGQIFATGFTKSSGWVAGGFDTSYNGGSDDAYIVKLNSNGDHLWSSYLGGSAYDVGNAVATIGTTALVVVGNTNSSNWISGGFDSTFGGNYDPFVARISDTNPPVPELLGDYNRNNKVDAADFALWRNSLNTFNVVPYSGADGNGDGSIGQEDYDVWRSHFGQSIPAVGAGSGAGAAALMAGEDETVGGVERQPMTSDASSQATSKVSAVGQADTGIWQPASIDPFVPRRTAGSSSQFISPGTAADRDAALTAWLIAGASDEQRDETDPVQNDNSSESGDKSSESLMDEVNSAFAALSFGG